MNNYPDLTDSQSQYLEGNNLKQVEVIVTVYKTITIEVPPYITEEEYQDSLEDAVKNDPNYLEIVSIMENNDLDIDNVIITDIS